MALQASCKTGNDGFSHLGIELAAGKVVEEKERSGALHGDVVDTVVDQIAANAGVEAHFESDFELGADAVCRADEYRSFEFLQIEPEEGSKAANTS